MQKWHFTDLHSFKDFVVFVQLCAPDNFPPREGVPHSEQWTLALAQEALEHGLRIAASEGVNESVLSECKGHFDKAFGYYRAANLHDGFKSMESALRILLRVPTK
jgi:hypothetical protein